MHGNERLKIFVAVNNESYGPISLRELQVLYNNHHVDSTSLIWFEGLKDWTELRNLNSLFKSVNRIVEPGSVKQHSDTQPIKRPSRASGKSYFLSHWRGDLSPGKTFWVNTVLPLSAAGFLGVNLDWFVDIVGGKFSEGGVWILLFALLMIFGCLFTWQSVGLWRASSHQEANSIINALIRAFVIFYSVSIVPTFAYLLLNFTSPSNLDFKPRQFSVTVIGESILIRGPLEYGVTERVASLLSANPHVQFVALDSEGGFISEANKLSEIIEKEVLDTVVVGHCLSACTRVFASGRERVVLHNANLGFHSSTTLLRDPIFNEAQTYELYSPLIEKGFPREFLRQVVDTPADDMWYAPTMPLYESGFITTIASSLDSLERDSMQRANDSNDPAAGVSFRDADMLLFNDENLKFPTLEGLLSYRKGDYVFELFDSMTFAENELLLVLVKEEDIHHPNFEDVGFRLYARVEIMLPDVRADHATFEKLKNLIASQYEELLLESTADWQTELDKGSQRFSQTIKKDVRFEDALIRPIQLLENNREYLIYEIEVVVQAKVDGTAQRVRQAGLQSLIHLNDSVVMVNWYCEEESLALKSEMYGLAKEFINSSISLNR